MSSSPGATYATGERARCIASVPGNGEQTVFAVGTQRLRGNNAVHFVAHDRDRDALVARGVYKHHPEIWDLQPSPTTDTLVATTHGPSSAAPDHGGAVWRVPGEGADPSGSASLESVAPFPVGGADSAGAARCARWRVGVGVDPSAPATGGTLAVADDRNVRLFQLDASARSAMALVAESRERVDADGDLFNRDFFSGSHALASVRGAWDPHAADAFAVVTSPTAGVDGVRVYDTRTMRVALLIPNPPASRRAGCHFADVEYDPRRAHRALTAGDDGAARAWDLRRAAAPTRVFAGHEHWVRRVCANPVYELMATASADGTARLWRDGPGDFADDEENDDDEKTKMKRRGGGADGDARDEGGPVETYGARGGVPCAAWRGARRTRGRSRRWRGTARSRCVSCRERRSTRYCCERTETGDEGLFSPDA